jgi:putative addiction module component (TIGR02574 family)
MDTKTILEGAMRLRPSERLQLIEMLARSLSKPDEDVEKIWAEESEKRYKALQEGKLKTVPLKEVIERYK